MIWIGIAGLALAAVCAYLARAAHARARSMESTETLPVRDLRSLHEAAARAAGPGNFRYRCEVAGHARPHRDGVLRSELEELECVWHRHKISRKYEEIYRDGNGNRKRRTRTDVLSEHSSSTAFFVADATGKVAVHPAGHEVVGAEKVLDRFDPLVPGGNRLELGPLSLNLGGGDGTLGYLREELARPPRWPLLRPRRGHRRRRPPGDRATGRGRRLRPVGQVREGTAPRCEQQGAGLRAGGRARGGGGSRADRDGLRPVKRCGRELPACIGREKSLLRIPRGMPENT